jgi:hypothetical protein
MVSSIPDGAFVPALTLSESLYRGAVANLVDVPHSAAHLGEGSDVLGFDTERSTDHGWGPRLQIFVEPDAVESVRRVIDERLPVEHEGMQVRYFRWETNRIESHVEVTTMREWFADLLGMDPRDGITTAQWLALPQQLVLEATQGAVFRDDSGELTSIRKLLQWYPDDVWLWVMACHWSQIGSILSFVGRAAEVGDDTGSRLAAAKIVRLLMRLCLAQARRYAPYDKWLGTAFARLDDGVALTSVVQDVLVANDHAAREEALAELCIRVAERHNDLGIGEPVPPIVAPHEVGIADAVRPYRVLNATPFVESCRSSISEPGLRNLNMVGAIDQLIDPTDPLIHFTDWPLQIARVYESKLQQPTT